MSWKDKAIPVQMHTTESTPDTPTRPEWMANAIPVHPDKYTSGRAALMGAEQGLTMGGADEAGGLLQMLLDSGQSGLHDLAPSMVGASPTQANAALAAQGVKGDVGPTTSGQFYRQAQQENEKEYDQAQQEHGGAFLAGNLAGGLLGMKGIGMATKAGPIANLLSKVTPTQVSEFLAAQKGAPGLRAILGKEGLGTAAKEVLKRGTIATAEAAPIGAAYGALDSKGTIENDPMQILQDTARGTLTAGGLGLGLNLASEVGLPLAQAGVQKLIPDREALKNFASNRAAAAVGVKATENAKRNIGQTLLDNNALPMTGGSEGIANAIQSAKTKIGNEQLSPILNEIQSKLGTEGAKNQTLAMNATSLFDDFANEIRGRPDADAVMQNIKKEIDPYLSKLLDKPNDINELQTIKQGLQDQAKDAYKKVQQGLDPAPKPDFLMKLASMVREHIEGLGDSVNPGLGNDLKQANSQWGNLHEAGKSINKLVNKDANKPLIGLPEILETAVSPHIGGPVAATNIASRMATGNSLTRLGNITAARGANWLSNVGRQPNKILDAGKSLYNASNEALQGFSQQLLGIPGHETTGQALQNALSNGDNTAKNAVLFSIMQTPRLRRLIHGESDQTDQK